MGCPAWREAGAWSVRTDLRWSRHPETCLAGLMSPNTTRTPPSSLDTPPRDQHLDSRQAHRLRAHRRNCWCPRRAWSMTTNSQTDRPRHCHRRGRSAASVCVLDDRRRRDLWHAERIAGRCPEVLVGEDRHLSTIDHAHPVFIRCADDQGKAILTIFGGLCTIAHLIWRSLTTGSSSVSLSPVPGADVSRSAGGSKGWQAASSNNTR